MSTYNVIIVVPGTTGTQLLDTKGNIVWPDKVATTSIYSPSTAAADLEDSTLQIGVIGGWTPGTNSGKGYSPLLYNLANASGTGTPYCANPNVSNWGIPAALTAPLVVGFPYDWRQDNKTSASLLQSFLKYLYNTYGSALGQISLIAHSMGGLLSRYYLEVLGPAGGPNKNPQADPWYGNINALITLGTPHLGAPLALQAVTGTLKITNYTGPLSIYGIPIPAAAVANFDTMAHDFVDNAYSDSTYELLPPPALNGMPASVQCIQDQTPANVPPAAALPPQSYSVYGANLPSYLQNALSSEGENSTNLANAGAALTKLGAVYASLPSYLPKYYCVYGLSSMYPTCTGMLFYNGKSASWTPVDAIQGGDQVVPAWSAMFQGINVAGTYRAVQAASGATTAVGSVNHFQLPGSPDAQTQIIQWLNLKS